MPPSLHGNTSWVSTSKPLSINAVRNPFSSIRFTNTPPVSPIAGIPAARATEPAADAVASMTAAWKPAARSARSTPARSPATSPAISGCRIEQRAVDAECQWCGVAAAGQVLEFDGRLALVGDLLTDAEQAGDGVEQPAHAATWEPGRHHGKSVAPECAYRRRRPRRPAPGHPPTRRPARRSRSSAMRAGLRTAPSPPGSANGARCPARVNRAGSVIDEKFTAPDGSVRPVAGAVVGDRHHRRIQPVVFGHQRNRVRVVVLHGHHVEVLSVRPSGGGVRRMQIAGDHRRPAVGDERHVLQGRVEAGLRARVGHVAEVRRHVRTAVGAHQAERRLQITAGRQDRGGRGRTGDGHRQRRVPAGATHRHTRAVGRHGHHRVLARRHGSGGRG